MKNYLYILSLMLFSGALAGCSNETIALTNAMQDKQETQKEAQRKQAIMSDGKEQKDTLWLKENSHFQFEVKDGEFIYTLFLFAEDEMSKLVRKEQYYSGHYSVYLAEKDSAVAYKQNILQEMEELTFHFSSEQVYPLNIGNKTLIGILQPQDAKSSTPLLLAVKDGEVQIVQTADVLPSIYGYEMKAINQKYLQTAHIQTNNEWKFVTWEYDNDAMKLIKIDESDLAKSDQAELFDHDWYSLWSEKSENYFPYLNLELNGDVIEKAKQGIPLGSPYPIGTNISNIKKAAPNFMMEGIQEGVPFVMYPEFTYFYNEASGIVTAVSIPGERMKMTMDEIIRLFGEPDFEGYDGFSQNRKAIYVADKYTIEVKTNVNEEVNSIDLQKK